MRHVFLVLTFFASVSALAGIHGNTTSVNCKISGYEEVLAGDILTIDDENRVVELSRTISGLEGSILLPEKSEQEIIVFKERRTGNLGILLRNRDRKIFAIGDARRAQLVIRDGSIGDKGLFTADIACSAR